MMTLSNTINSIVVGLFFSIASTTVLAEAPLAPEKTLTFKSGNQQVSLLELYSSQGCSSCPPAERWVSTLKNDPRLWQSLVPLVFHVDYWDYLGWKDPYASSKHSQRQRTYRLHRYSNAVYTPGFMLAGKEWTRWFRKRQLPTLATPQRGNLALQVQGKNFKAQFTDPKPGRKLRLNIAILGFDITTDIKRGENRGKRLPQDFVVLEHIELQTTTHKNQWQGKLPDTNHSGKKAVAVWVSEEGDPRPVQATGGWL